jgi:glycosyltransferase involved in cell wall biosynthesis
MLVVVETHPIQYRSPVYQYLSGILNVPITVIYGSDFSVVGYKDKEFGTEFAWDTDLLSGYPSRFLSNVEDGGAKSFEEISPKGLGKIIEELKPKALLITGYNHPLYRSAFYQGWKSKIPILFRAETNDFAFKRNWLKSWLRDQILSFLYKQCSSLMYIGKNSKTHFQRLGVPKEKLIFSPYCVDTKPFKLGKEESEKLRAATRHQLNITQKKKVLIFSGKLSYRKGVDLILPAVKSLPSESQKEIVILFLGDGELKEEIKQQAEKLNLSQVHFLGFQNQNKLSNYYHCADMLLLPSRYSETWGLVVNEALHHGLPCVVSDAVGCAVDLITTNQTGSVFTTNSISGFSQAIDESLTLCHSEKIKKNCQKRINDYSLENAAKGIAQSYYSIF